MHDPTLRKDGLEVPTMARNASQGHRLADSRTQSRSRARERETCIGGYWLALEGAQSRACIQGCSNNEHLWCLNAGEYR